MQTLIASALPVIAQIGHHMDWDGGGWAWLWMAVMMIAGIILVVVILFLLFRSTVGGAGYTAMKPPHESPLDIAKRRYAAGEISKEEFEQIKKDLSA